MSFKKTGLHGQWFEKFVQISKHLQVKKCVNASLKTSQRKPNGDTGELVGETKKAAYSLPKGSFKKGLFIDYES